MRRIIYIIGIVITVALGMVLPTACISPMPEGDVVLEGGEVEHTLVMYLIADNNLTSSLMRNARDAEKGMIGALPQSRLLVYLDSATETTLYEVRYRDYGSEEHVRYCKELKKYPRQMSTTPEVMRQVMEDVKTLAPSKSYGLVLAGHGSGWFPKPSSGTSYDKQKVGPMASAEYSFMPLVDAPQTRFMGWDNDYEATGEAERTDRSYITTGEMREGLSPIHFDYIIFDACFMASVEFLYEMKDCADYIIASPVEILSCGLPYEAIVGNLMSTGHDVFALGDIIMDVYMRDNEFTERKSLALATIDCSKLEALAESVAAIYESVKIDNPATTTEQLVNMFKVQVLDRMVPAAFYDLDDFVYQLTDDEALRADFRKALDEVIVESIHTDDIYSAGYSPQGYFFGYDFIETKVDGRLDLCGLSCWAPRSKTPITYEHYMQTAWARRVYGLDGE